LRGIEGGIIMPVCEICGEDVTEISECRECGTLFCNNCGDTVEELCEYCQEEEDWDVKPE
jgi:hypothetical protein